MIPIYARGREAKDPRQTEQERPSGQRTEAPPLNRGFFPWDQNGPGFTFNIGVFPFFPFGIQMVRFQCVSLMPRYAFRLFHDYFRESVEAAMGPTLETFRMILQHLFQDYF